LLSTSSAKLRIYFGVNQRSTFCKPIDILRQTDLTSQDFFRKLDSEAERVKNEKDLTFDLVERLTSEWSGIISQTAIGSSDPLASSCRKAGHTFRS
jgi:hypothetical protein